MRATQTFKSHALFNTICALAALGAGVSQSPMARAQAISEQEAHDIGVSAYLYFYSPVTMDLTRLQSTNIEPGKDPFKPSTPS